MLKTVSKAIAGLLACVGTWAASVMDDGITTAEWWALVAPVAGFVVVYLAPKNAEQETA